MPRRSPLHACIRIGHASATLAAVVAVAASSPRATLAGPPWPALAGPHEWRLIGGSPARPRLCADMILDPATQRLVVFGGTNGVHLNSVQTFTLDGQDGAWSALTPAGQIPEGRRETSLILDPVRHRLLMFGGLGGMFLGDLYALNLEGTPTWQPLTTRGEGPGPRGAHGAVYDARRDRMIVIFGSDGGLSGKPRLDDLWELPFSGARPMVWRRMSPRGPAPSGRSCFSAVYDSVGDRVVLFGGTDPAFRNDLWQLSLAGTGSWRRIEVEGPGPSPRESHAAAFDPECQVMVLHGGIDATHVLGDTWLLELAGAPRWLPIDGGALTRRWGHAATFDPARRRMVIHGGWGDSYLGETWALEIMPCIRAARPGPGLVPGHGAGQLGEFVERQRLAATLGVDARDPAQR